MANSMTMPTRQAKGGRQVWLRRGLVWVVAVVVVVAVWEGSKALFNLPHYKLPHLSAIWEAFLRFPTPPTPGGHGPRHRVMARLAAVDLVLTACTGTVFYWLAFVATR